MTKTTHLIAPLASNICVRQEKNNDKVEKAN